MAGTADDLETTATTLREIERRYCSTYAARSGLPTAEVMRMMRAETWLPAERAVELGLADAVDGTIARAATVSKAVLRFQRVPMEVRAMAGAGPKPTRTAAQRDRLRRRLMLVAQQVRFGRDPKRDEEDRERGARMRRRYEMQATVEAIKADDRKVDAAERAANRERQQRDYYYNWQGVPHGQRR